MNKPIFITGVYRSGTTLISAILNNHSELSVTYDSVHFMRFSYNKYNPIRKKQNYRRLVMDTHERLFKRFNMIFDPNEVFKEVNKLNPVDYSGIYDAIMRALLLKNKYKKRWGEKTNICWGQIPNFLKMFPDGKTIHVIRDPRDVLCSYKKMTTEPGLRYLDCAFTSLDSFNAVRRYRSYLDSKNYYYLRYEDFVRNPQDEIQKLCKFLEADFELHMLDHARFKDKKGNPWKGDSSFDLEIDGISTKPIGRWKTNANRIEIFIIEMILRERMLEFDYEPTGIFLTEREWNELYGILKDPFINKRFCGWLKTAEGVEAYPSDPLRWGDKIPVKKK